MTLAKAFELSRERIAIGKNVRVSVYDCQWYVHNNVVKRDKCKLTLDSKLAFLIIFYKFKLDWTV
jgi:hypothetical protein